MSDMTTLTTEMTEAVTRFLEGLTSEQRKKAVMPFGDDQERRRWFYTPTPRAGLPLVEMAPKQQQTVMHMLSKGLSEPGYNHAAIIMGLERVVDYTSNFPDRTYGDLPGTRVRDPGNYCVAVFGDPSDDSGWSWRIGGHHLSLHYTVRDGQISPTPAFFGAEPARLRMPGGALLRPLSAEEDLARDLLRLLRPEQQAQAVISPIAPTDIVQRNNPKVEEGSLPQIGGTGPGGQGLRDLLGLTPEHDEKHRYTSQPKGLPGGSMDPTQLEVFKRLISAYFEHLPDAIVEPHLKLIAPDALEKTTFAWAGPDEFAAPHYYRVQGERLLIEYDCTQNNANHTHSVWRDPQGDFGDDLLAQHYAAAHTR